MFSISGTFPLSVLAHEHGIPVYAVVPTSTIDLTCENGDLIEIDAHKGIFSVLETHNGEGESSSSDWEKEPFNPISLGLGRELFSIFRNNTSPADQGALSLDWLE